MHRTPILSALAGALALAALYGCPAPEGIDFSTGAAGSSASPPPSGEPLYLTFNGRVGSEAEASAYIAANNQPTTLDAFKTGACLTGGSPLQYFNFADLGLGRTLTFARCGDRIAACVENAGMPGQNEFDGLHAVDGTSKVAVCMDYIPTRPPPFKVQFYVYAEGKPATGLQFDRQGTKFSPFACTDCHGGRMAEQDAQGQPFQQVANGFMLPLLEESLVFPDATDEETLRGMNALVYEVANDPDQRAQGILDMLDAAYPSPMPGAGVGQSGAMYVENAVSQGWQGEPALYLGLVRPYCMNCHAGQIENVGFPMTTSTEYEALGPLIGPVVCQQKAMPNSLEGRKRFNGDGVAQHLAGCE